MLLRRKTVSALSSSPRVRKGPDCTRKSDRPQCCRVFDEDIETKCDLAPLFYLREFPSLECAGLQQIILFSSSGS